MDQTPPIISIAYNIKGRSWAKSSPLRGWIAHHSAWCADFRSPLPAWCHLDAAVMSELAGSLFH